VKIATWNVNSIKSRLEHAVRWAAGARPDVLCLQEIKVPGDAFPKREFELIGYEHQAVFGETAYNGVAILSRTPIADVEMNLPEDPAEAQRRLIAGMIDGIRIFNAYAPHGTKLGSDRYQYKLDWLARLRKFFDDKFTTDDDVILCGDLNVAPHEMDVWKPQAWKDKLHFSKPEREALMELKRWGFVDLFRQFNGDAREFSWWSNFHNDFEKDRGLRIDFIWSSPSLAEDCTDCWIDREPRGWEHPSDHAPVLAEFD
jgi:exodeoxyribonuclease-3